MHEKFEEDRRERKEERAGAEEERDERLEDRKKRERREPHDIPGESQHDAQHARGATVLKSAARELIKFRGQILHARIVSLWMRCDQQEFGQVSDF